MKMLAINLSCSSVRHGFYACLIGSNSCQFKGGKGDELPRSGLLLFL